MKVLLMHRDRDFDFDPEQRLARSQHEQALIQDLELDTLFSAMALGDRFLFRTASHAVLSGLGDSEAILYRQQILQDCLQNPDVVRTIYSIPIESIESQKKNWMGIFSRYPAGILSSAIEMLELFVRLLKKLKAIADEHAQRFQSEGFTRFFAMIQQELDDDYFSLVDNHLQQLKFRNGVLLSVELGKGNEGAEHVLRKPNDPDQN